MLQHVLVEHFIYPSVDGHLACFHLFRWGSGHSNRERVLVVDGGI